MYGERKTSWKCHVCKPRSRSPNTLYQAVVFDDNNNKKQARTDDEENADDQSKKFKETMSLTSVNNKICSVQSDVKDLAKTIEQLSTNVNTLSLQIKEDIHLALTTITNTITTLVAQVKDLNEKDKQRDTQINAMETRINKLEQQTINKNIEIKNIQNKQISEFDVVKTIGASINVEIREEDISKAYRLKKQNDKVIVEFSTLNKKDEFMSKIDRHRVQANIINNNNNNENKYIYINDQLTYNNRRLLWLAKTKANEAKWKYVWVRNGNIFARKSENSPLFVINNAADIESINNSM